jgi:hypothetical protein
VVNIPSINGVSISTDVLAVVPVRVSTEVTFWHSAEYGSDFRCNSGEIPRNSAEFRAISPELSRNHFRSQKIPRNSVSAEFRGHPSSSPLIFPVDSFSAVALLVAVVLSPVNVMEFLLWQ